jgi:hypothetical protein
MADLDGNGMAGGVLVLGWRHGYHRLKAGSNDNRNCFSVPGQFGYFRLQDSISTSKKTAQINQAWRGYPASGAFVKEE